MTWLLTAYLLAMIYLAVNPQKLPSSASLRLAWLWFAMIPISHFVFALFRAGYYPNAKDLALVEIWSDGIAWLLFGASLLCLTGVVAQDARKSLE